MGPAPNDLDSANGLVTTALAGDASLAVAVCQGAAELERAAVLSGSAGLLVRELGLGAREEEIASWLLAHGAGDAGRAGSDARRLRRELDLLGPAPVAAAGAAAPRPRAEPAGERGPTDAGAPHDAVTPEAWARLAREVLAHGHRLRFRARGRSMRPLIPHGSLLEVEPRAFERVRLGDVVLHSAALAPLVAHRVVGRREAGLLTRGDSNARIDTVAPAEFLGVVVRRESRGRWKPVSSGLTRWLGLAAGLAYRVLVGAARLFVLRPLRATFGGTSLVRGALRVMLRVGSAGLLGAERVAIRLRRPLDVLRAALLSSAEKDRERSRLYRRKAIQEFTSLEENVRSGLTLLEEVLLARHPLAPGKVLVLGCGPGRECLALARMGHAVTGIDREEGMLARARELAREAGLDIRYVTGEAVDFQVPGGPFDAVVIFSGLYNMLLPRERRVRMLRASRAHLAPRGTVLVTFLSAYLWPGEPEAASGRHFLEALNPEHERGDLYLLNEAIHVFPGARDVADEAREAGLETVDLFRDQRAYDRASGQVRGYAVLRSTTEPGGGGVRP